MVELAVGIVVIVLNYRSLSGDVRALRESVAGGGTLRSVRFSAVSSVMLVTLLSKLHLCLYHGELSELNVRRRGSTTVVPFPWTHATENAGLPHILAHIKEQLTRLGVLMGMRGGFDLLDVHSAQALLSFTVAGVRYGGGVDAVIVPHNVAPESAAQQSRVVFDIKRRSPDPSERGLRRHYGQSMAELIGASVRSA